MELEAEVQETESDDVNADIAEAMKELDAPDRGDDGKFKAEKEPEAKQSGEPKEAQEPVEKPVEEKKDDSPTAPQSWSAAAKEEWKNATPVLRAEILKRENDIHQALTRHDGELRLGREMKDVVMPYMASIQAEGGTPATAVASLLNTAHILRTGTDEQKRHLILTTAKQFNVDLGVQEESEYVDPTIAALQNEIKQLREIANPQAIESRLRQSFESDKVKSDVDAFASDSANVHFQTVRPLMVAMLNSGQAGDLKEAYDMACMANPTIRSTLLAAQAAEQQAKRKQEVEAKKRAASSIAGSPAIPSNSKATNNSQTSVEDDLRAAFDALESQI